MKRVLVLCTGNSCRSIMAEALINTLGAGRYEAVSAGSHPTGDVHPKAIETLQRHGIDAGAPRSKSWDAFADQHFDLVITVCDAAAAESCPAFLGKHEKLHWSTPDPAKATGTEDEIDKAFDEAFEMLKEKVKTLLPHEDQSFKNFKKYMSENKTILQADYLEGEGFYLSKKLNPMNFATSYVISADYLIEASKHNEMEPIIVWPVLFLYRHAIELFLKQALQALSIESSGHDISVLNGKLQEKLIELEENNAGNQPELSLLPEEDIFRSIMEFHSISPRSTELRYEDAGLIGGDSHMLIGNYMNAQFHARRAAKYFDLLEQKIQHLKKVK